MIKRILTCYAGRLNEYLSRLHHQPEGLVEAGFVGNGSEEKPNKMVVSLFGIERETSGAFPHRCNARRKATHALRPLCCSISM